MIGYPTDNSYWKRVFSISLNDQAWIDKANDLLVAMNVLRPSLIEFLKSLVNLDASTQIKTECRVHGVYLMLSAYAMENLLKALILRTDESIGQNIENNIPEEIKDHDLVSLAKKCGVEFTDHGVELLMRLS